MFFLLFIQLYIPYIFKYIVNLYIPHTYSIRIAYIFHTYPTHIPYAFHTYSNHIPHIFHAYSKHVYVYIYKCAYIPPHSIHILCICFIH